VKNLYKDLKGKDFVESSSLVSSMKTESDAYDARPEAEKGNNTQTSSPINLKSSLDSKDDKPISQKFANLQKAKTPTPSSKPSPKLRPILDQDDVSKKIGWFDPPSVKPNQTLLPSDMYDGDTLIPQDYLDKKVKLDKIDTDRVIRERKAYFQECAIRIKKCSTS